MNALSLRQVNRYFGGVKAVCDVQLDVAYGERVALIGPNGAGKTTLFNLISGDLPVTSGRIELLGRDVTRLPVHARARLGMRRTYQVSTLFDTLTVRENLYLSMLGSGTWWDRINPLKTAFADRVRLERVDATAAAVGIADRLSAQVSELSHGERRQVEIGLVMATDPQLMLLDEPAAGLSSSERATMLGLLGALPAEATILLIEHDMNIALRFAERVIVLHEGRVIADGVPGDVQGNALVHQIYLGGSADA